MANPPALRSLSAEVFADAQDPQTLAQKLVEVLGPFISDCANAFDALMLPNRHEQIEPSVTFTTTGASALTNVKFKNRLPQAPKFVDIGQIRPTSPSASLVINVGKPIWKYGQDGQVYIEHIGGLAASTQYKATFLVK
jgi:hypothetical protein